MLSIEELACLDLHAWLGTQQAVAEQLVSSQSRICRIAKRSCHRLNELGLTLTSRSHPVIADDQGLLAQLRTIHQALRFHQQRGLRLQATTWLRHLALEPVPCNWVVNPAPLHGSNNCASLALLEERVIDAAPITGPEAVADEHPQLCFMTLSRKPLQILVHRQHCLARDKGLTIGDIADNSTLTHSSFINPGCRRILERMDAAMIASGGRPCRRLESAAARLYGNAMTCLLKPELVALDFETPYTSADVVAPHHDWSTHPALRALLTLLRDRLSLLRKRIPSLDLPS